MSKGLVNASNDIDFEETWSIVSSSLREMHTRNASKLSFEAIYRHAYKIVLKKKGDIFYERLQKFESDWLSKEVRAGLMSLLAPSLLPDSQSGASTTTANERRGAGEKFLKGLKDQWEHHQTVMNMATDVFMYLVCFTCETNSVEITDFSYRIVYIAATADDLQSTHPPCFNSETVFFEIRLKETPRQCCQYWSA